MELKDLQEFDVKKMYETYDKWPEIARESYKKTQVNSSYNEVNRIAVCGMGGSGALGDFIASILSKEKIHVSVIKGYTLPANVDKDTLLIAISISGDTEETLSALKQGYETGQLLGNKLKKLEQKWIENNFIIEKNVIEKSLGKENKN